MAIIPKSEHSISAMIDKHHEKHQDLPRPHMGASTLGHSCDRWLWLSFRWAVVEQFPGRILRLFKRGQDEEATVVSNLRAIGLNVQKTGTNQSRVDFGSHVSGSVDGLIEYGVPESPDKPHVLEIKTHALKSFNALVKDGVEKSKPMHYVQMQLYMSGLGVDRALYYAVCKDNDEIHTERVKLDKDVVKKAIERGHRLVQADRMPPPLSADPSWYECKFCPAHEFCHKTQLTKQVNCRTCAHSTAKPDSTWSCEKYDVTLSVDNQRDGCESHILHPDLVPWKYTSDGDAVVWHTPTGDVRNGQSSFDTYASTEIVANHAACTTPDQFMADARAIFGAKVVG